MDEGVQTKLLERLAAAAAVGFVVLVLLACSTWSDIRVVHASAAGGEIALQGNRDEAFQKARVEMSRTCGGLDRFEVAEEYDASLADGGTAATAVADRRLRYVCVVPAQPAS